jgi:hypothetical protein
MHEAVSPTERDDLRSQSAVLEFVLSQHPILLTLSDLLMEIKGEDAVSRAVRELIAVGLLRREGGSVLPTRAAIHFDRLSA